MFGFFFGTLCLIAFVKLARRGCCGRGGGYGCHGGGHRWGHGGCHGGRCGAGHHGGHGPWGGWGPGHYGRERWMLRMLFERLDTTPGQEKVIVAAFEESRDAMRAAWQSVRESREDLGRALRADTFDEDAIRAARSRHEEALGRAHDTLTGALRKVHEALDARQRGVLADLLAEGPFGARAAWRGGFGPGGPYRTA